MLKVLIAVGLICCLPVLADAGWLSDKLKQSSESIADRLIDDAADATYEKTRQESEEVFEEDQESEFEENGDSEEPPWAGTQPIRKSKKRTAAAPIRTDLHFSAETLMIDPESSPTPMKGKMFVDGARMRWDMSTPDGNVSTIVTGNKPQDKVYTLMHSQRMYMEVSIENVEEDLWSSLSAADNPCDGYRSARQKGQKTLNSRSTVEWECADPEEEDYPDSVVVWLDKRLKIPIRYQESNGTEYEMTSIDESSPDDEVFKVPSNYRILSIGVMSQ